MIRVLLVKLPGLIDALMRQAVEAEPDMTVVAQDCRPEGVGLPVSTDEIDVIVTEIGKAGSLRLEALAAPLARQLPILGISADGSSVELYDVHVVQEISQQQIVEIIRNVAQRKARGLG